jgi:predicted small secreted protein
MQTHQCTLTQRIVLSLLVATLLATVGLGCNTAKGFGKDVESTGEAIQDGTD